MKKSLAIAKINLKYSNLAYRITAIALAAVLISTFVNFCIGIQDNSSVSPGNMLFLALILSAVFIPTINFKNIMHLNGKKIDFFFGSFLHYVSLSAILSALNLIIYYTLDKLVMTRTGLFNIVEIFGWTEHGVFIAFLQQFAFLLLLAVVIHTLTSLQSSWVGWTIDLVIAAIISVFTPIVSLREYLIGFFNLILFNSNFSAQIWISIICSVVIYTANLPILIHKKITS